MPLLMTVRKFVFILGTLITMTSFTVGAERQITTDVNRNHELDNNDNFSPDDRSLVFDTRTNEGGIAASKTISKVEVDTGLITPLYETKQPNAFGPGVGAASYSHCRDEVIFIHGPFHPTDLASQYEQFRRVGVIARGDGSGKFHLADARSTVSPYLVGALRGGTHRHEFSGDGNWVGFTYNDAVVAAHGREIGQNLNLRTIGVTQLGNRLSVPPSLQFPGNAHSFSVLVVAVVSNPQPGSDEISRADQDSWIGRKGYLLEDGTRQLSRAFIGTTRNSQGEEVDELFVVDIPPDITSPGLLGPLEGTESTLPSPPTGTAQRRLTDSSQRHYSGCKGIVRASHDGKQIAFLMKDEQEAWQVFLISPLGGEPRQATSIEGGVDSGVRWHPNGKTIASVAGTRILLTTVEAGPQFGNSWVLSDRKPAPFALVWSHDGTTIAYNRRVQSEGREATQIFVADYRERE